MKKIVISCEDQQQKDKLLKEISAKAGESVKIIVEQQHSRQERNSTSSSNILSIYVAILLLKIIFEIDNTILEPYLGDLYGLIQIFIDYLVKKTRREPPSQASFDMNTDILESYFCCDNIDCETEQNQGFLQSYKGYTILILRIIIKNIETFTFKHGMEKIVRIFRRVIQELGNVDYELKTEAIILIRCLILPHTITSDVYKSFKKSNIFSFEEKVDI